MIYFTGSSVAISSVYRSEESIDNTIEVGQGSLKLIYSARDGKLSHYANNRNLVCYVEDLVSQYLFHFILYGLFLYGVFFMYLLIFNLNSKLTHMGKLSHRHVMDSDANLFPLFLFLVSNFLVHSCICSWFYKILYWWTKMVMCLLCYVPIEDYSICRTVIQLLQWKRWNW